MYMFCSILWSATQSLVTFKMRGKWVGNDNAQPTPILLLRGNCCQYININGRYIFLYIQKLREILFYTGLLNFHGAALF